MFPAVNGAVIVIVPVGVEQVGCAVTDNVGAAGTGFTVTVTVLVVGQPEGVALVTVYVLPPRVVGLAVTVAPLVVLSPVPGLQLYVPLPPLAVRFTLCPLQIEGAEGLISRMFTPEFAASVKLQRSPLAPSISK